MIRVIIIAIMLIEILIAGCATSSNVDNNFTERNEIAMGTVVTLKASGANAQIAINEAFQQISNLETQLNEDKSKLESNAGNNEYIQINKSTYNILKTAQEYAALTDGTFDVTIGAAVELWGIGTSKANVPSSESLNAVKNLVDYRHLHLNTESTSAKLDHFGMKLDFGGIAKGYAVDRVREIFEKHGITDGLIDFGTSTIYALGDKKIGLKNPRQAGELAKIVSIKNAAISTSGDYEKYFEVDGKRYSHILNPRTCAPAETTNIAVSVIVDGSVENCATVADILSTIFMIDSSADFLAKVPPNTRDKIKYINFELSRE